MHIGNLWHDELPPPVLPNIHGVSWFDLPKSIRQIWWRETGYGRHPPSPEFMASLPELIAVEHTRREDDKREAAAETVRTLAELRQARELARKWFPSRMRM
jgi:hypothetical protein